MPSADPNWGDYNGADLNSITTGLLLTAPFPIPYPDTATPGYTGAYMAFSTDVGFNGSSGNGIYPDFIGDVPDIPLTGTFDIDFLVGAVVMGFTSGGAFEGKDGTREIEAGNGWQSFTVSSGPGADGFLLEGATSGAVSLYLANVSVHPSGAPEPFTMGVGIAGIGLAVRRRLKAKSLPVV